MGNCTMKTRKKITVIMLGLDHSGKTTTVKGLLGECAEDTAPTWGFSTATVRHGKFKVAIHDVGGARNIRNIWKNYFAEAYGMIYVVDASDALRIDECRNALHDILRHPNIGGKPLLILANKQDVDGAFDETDICGALDVEQLVNEAKICTRVEICTALRKNCKKPERSIQDGFHWLVSVIAKNYSSLRTRVDRDTAEQRQLERTERTRREERVRKLREERNEVDVAEVEDKELEDPFRPLADIVQALNGPEVTDVTSEDSLQSDLGNLQIFNLVNGPKKLPPILRQLSRPSSGASRQETHETNISRSPVLQLTPTRQILVRSINEDEDGRIADS